MKSFNLQILASDRVFFNGRCTMAVMQAPDGEIGVMAYHADIVLAIEIGEIRIQKEDGTWMKALLGKGVMQFINNRMTILTEFAELPEEIDEKRAQAAKERAEERLRQQQSILQYHQSKAALARAIARLKEKSNKPFV